MEKNFYIVAIGCSSGGLAALKDFFARLSYVQHAAFIVLQHLQGNVRSMSDRLLKPHTPMPVYRAEENQLIHPGAVYVLPEGQIMTIENGRLHLEPRKPEQIINWAVDIFFKSMGEDLKERAIGIVLSGAGTDGTLGGIAIHRHGGVMMVQKPSTAEYEGMPQSMADSNYANFNMPIPALVNTLQELIKNAS